MFFNSVSLVVAAASVIALSPTTGPARGQSLVIVTGSNFVAGNTWCKFALTHSGNLCVRHAAALHFAAHYRHTNTPLVVPVEITNNNGDYTWDNVSFYYKRAFLTFSVVYFALF